MFVLRLTPHIGITSQTDVPAKRPTERRGIGSSKLTGTVKGQDGIRTRSVVP